MNFSEYLNKAWTDHATNAQKVADEFSTGVSLITEESQIADLASLITHVCGEHLGKWNEGIARLAQLKNLAQFKAGPPVDSALSRSIAALNISSDPGFKVDNFSVSDQVRILAIASSALAGFQTERASDLLKNALALAEKGLAKEDPANRSLAITGNNLACTLEEKKDRSASDVNLMILAAETARKYWELAGTWMEVERAEYRLSMTYLQAGDVDRAWRAAQNCLEGCFANNADALEVFFAYESLATVERARGNNLEFNAAVTKMRETFNKMEESNRKWCEPSFVKLGIVC